MKSADWTFATLRKRYCTTRIALGRDNRTSARLLQFGKKIVDKRRIYGANPSSTLSEACCCGAGDFNQSTRFDANRSPDGHFARVLELISRLGLVSAWHEFHDERFGEEKSPTCFHRWKQDQAFHIDYIFVPRNVPIPLSNSAPMTRSP